MKTVICTTRRFPWAPMFTLAFTVFTLVTSEFLPTGMLPTMVVDLSVSTSLVGLLVSVWAGTVVVTAVPLSLVTPRYPRKQLLVIAVLFFALSNILAATAVGYPMLVASRILGGVGNALFWMIATGSILSLLPPRHHSAGFLFINGGANLAFIVGLPLGTALSAVANWRITFAVMTLATLMAAAALTVFLSPIPHAPDTRVAYAAEPWDDQTFPVVSLTAGVVFLVVAGNYVFYPYVTPFLIEIAGFNPFNVSFPLAIYGLGGVFGISIAAWLGRNPERLSRNLFSALIFLATVLATVTHAGSNHAIVVVSVALWSFGFSLADPLYGQLIMEVASPRLRDFASALRTTAWNLGIGGGSLVGGLVLIPFGISVLPYLGAGIVLLAAVLTLILRRHAHALDTNQHHPAHCSGRSVNDHRTINLPSPG